MNEIDRRPFAMFINPGEGEFLRETDADTIAQWLVDHECDQSMFAAAAYDAFFALGDEEKATKILQLGKDRFGAQAVADACSFQLDLRIRYDGVPIDGELPFANFAIACLPEVFIPKT